MLICWGATLLAQKSQARSNRKTRAPTRSSASRCRAWIFRPELPENTFMFRTFACRAWFPGRVVRPSAVGAKLVSVDESSIRDVPGLVKVVVKGNFVGVVCEREEQAIRAAREI